MSEVSKIPLDELTAMYAGRPFDNGKSLKDYFIESKCIVNVKQEA